MAEAAGDSRVSGRRIVDRIYGLHSLLKRAGLDLPDPDYNKPLERVFEETVVAYIRSFGDLSILELAARWEKREKLPSWVPAWYSRQTDSCAIASPHSNPCVHFSWEVLSDFARPVRPKSAIGGHNKTENSSNKSICIHDFQRIRHYSGALSLRGIYLGRITFRGFSGKSGEEDVGNLRDWCRRICQAASNGSKNLKIYPELCQDIAKTALWGGLNPQWLWTINHHRVDFCRASKVWFDVLMYPAQSSTWFGRLAAEMGCDGNNFAVELYESYSNSPEDLPHSARALDEDIRSFFRVEDRRRKLRRQGDALIILDDGRFGQAPSFCQEGDGVFLLPGADCPFVLRQSGTGGEFYQFVAPAYINGEMDCSKLSIDEADLRDITLV